AHIGNACAFGLALAVVTAALLIPSLYSAPGTQGNPVPTAVGHGKYSSPPGHPFLMTLAPGGGRAVLRNAATGATLAALRPQYHGGSFAWVAAAPDDRLFVLGEGTGHPGTTKFEVLQLSGGRPASRSAWQASTTGQVYGVAVSPDDSAFAVATMP